MLVDLEGVRKVYFVIKKIILLYIGFVMGFCGFFMFFFVFMRDVFFVFLNDLFVINVFSRSGGYIFFVFIVIFLIIIFMFLVGFFFGVYMVIFFELYMLLLFFFFISKILDCLIVLFGWGCWLGVIIMFIFLLYDSW